MPNHFRGGRWAALIVCSTLLLTAACSSSKSTTSSGGSSGSSSSDNTAAVLGPANAATGTPIKIGYVSDGPNASFGTDVPQVATFNGTVKYANEHLGGLNGHVIEVDHCSTDATPAGATQCAVQLTKDGVAAVLVAVSANDGALKAGFEGSGIPYFTYESADSNVLLQPGVSLMTNPISQIAVPALIAKEQGIKKVGFIIIDVPAATGPITAIAQPIFKNLGVELQIIPISPSVADVTPQLQEAISGGAGLFAVTGTDDFNISAINGLLQLGFTGPVFTGNPSATVLKALTSLTSLVAGGTQTDAKTDPDVQLKDAVVATYTDIAPGDASDSGVSLGFATALGFVRALTGVTAAVDAPTISAALNPMAAPVPMPLGGGITFQCGTKPVAFAPAICSTDVLQWTYDSDGKQTNTKQVVVPASALTLS